MPDLSRRAVLSGAATSLAAAGLAACGEVPVVPGAGAAARSRGFRRRRLRRALRRTLRPGRGGALPDPGRAAVAHQLGLPSHPRDLSARRAAGHDRHRSASRLLYLVQEGGRAIRYGVGVGRQGFAWSGVRDDQRQAGMAGLVSAEGDDRPPARSAQPAQRAAQRRRRARAARAIRWARAPCTCGRATRTRSTASTARSSRGRSARTSPPAASA